MYVYMYISRIIVEYFDRGSKCVDFIDILYSSDAFERTVRPKARFKNHETEITSIFFPSIDLTVVFV